MLIAGEWHLPTMRAIVKNQNNPKTTSRPYPPDRSADSKPHPLWLPSQNGRFFETPQRQSAKTGLSIVYSFPSASTSLMGPSTKNGPLSRMLIFVSDMLSPLLGCGGSEFIPIHSRQNVTYFARPVSRLRATQWPPVPTNRQVFPKRSPRRQAANFPEVTIYAQDEQPLFY